MTRDQEDRIIKQAQDILERRLAVENEIKVSAQKLDIDCIRLYLEAIITKAEKLQKDILHKRTLAKEIYILAENALKKLKEI
jgi:hypothetical protein